MVQTKIMVPGKRANRGGGGIGGGGWAAGEPYVEVELNTTERYVDAFSLEAVLARGMMEVHACC
jgi:hypothetical protein